MHMFLAPLVKVQQVFVVVLCPFCICSCVHMCVTFYFNSLPNNNILVWSKFKAFADDKIYVTEICYGKGRKYCGTGENAGYQHILLFPLFSQKALSSGPLKLGIEL